MLTRLQNSHDRGRFVLCLFVRSAGCRELLCETWGRAFTVPLFDLIYKYFDSSFDYGIFSSEILRGTCVCESRCHGIRRWKWLICWCEGKVLLCLGCEERKVLSRPSCRKTKVLTCLGCREAKALLYSGCRETKGLSCLGTRKLRSYLA